jgi:hypothetical protein
MSNFHSSKDDQKDLMTQSLEKRLLETTQELHKAHKIIFNALQLMNVEQKSAWAKANQRTGLGDVGPTRVSERDVALNYLLREWEDRPSCVRMPQVQANNEIQQQ